MKCPKKKLLKQINVINSSMQQVIFEIKIVIGDDEEEFYMVKFHDQKC